MFPSSLFTSPIMLQSSRPLQPNNLEKRTCMFEEVQTYSEVAQEAFYVQIPKKECEGAQGDNNTEFSKYTVCKYSL